MKYTNMNQNVKSATLAECITKNMNYSEEQVKYKKKKLFTLCIVTEPIRKYIRIRKL